MKRRVSVIILILMTASLCEKKKKKSTGSAETATESKAESQAENGASEENVDEAPKTATEPPALHKDDLPNPIGSPDVILWGEEDCEVILDQGEDGLTLTKNGFDENGDLIWWEAFEFNADGLPVKGTTRDPDGEILRWEKLGYYLDFNSDSTIYDSADVVRAEYSYRSEDGSIGHVTLYDENGKKQLYVAYDSDGSERSREEYDENGELIREYRDGYLAMEFPDSELDVLKLLNETPDEDFEEVFASCIHHMEEAGQKDRFDELCKTVSATLDYIGTPMQALYEQYRLCLGIYNMYFSDIRDMVEEGLNPKLQEAIYQEGCSLDYAGTAWIPELFDQALPDTPPEEKEEYSQIRIVYLDSSSAIYDKEMTLENLSIDYVASNVCDQMQELLDGIFGNDPRVIMEGDPAQADVILNVNVSYSFAGTYYYEDGSPANVYATQWDITATDRRSDKSASVRFAREPGDTLYGHTENVYMSTPDFEEEPYRSDADAFADTIYGWYGLQTE